MWKTGKQRDPRLTAKQLTFFHCFSSAGQIIPFEYICRGPIAVASILFIVLCLKVFGLHEPKRMVGLRCEPPEENTHCPLSNDETNNFHATNVPYDIHVDCVRDENTGGKDFEPTLIGHKVWPQNRNGKHEMSHSKSGTDSPGQVMKRVLYHETIVDLFLVLNLCLTDNTNTPITLCAPQTARSAAHAHPILILVIIFRLNWCAASNAFFSGFHTLFFNVVRNFYRIFKNA